MTQDIKDEALEQIIFDVKAGFENEAEIFDGIVDMFYDAENFDQHWLKQKIAEVYTSHQQESVQWERPTDFDRLAATFDLLAAAKIVCLHNAGYTKQDGESDCLETIESLHKLGLRPVGFCYYHSQDLGRAVDPESRNLWLGFDSPTQNNNEALKVASSIVAALSENGFQVKWPGTVDQRIEIQNIDWKKIPDNQDWGQGRVIAIMTKLAKERKPFWKFW